MGDHAKRDDLHALRDALPALILSGIYKPFHIFLIVNLRYKVCNE
jgi:hypothetical protein